jgi:hypothetical protein
MDDNLNFRFQDIMEFVAGADKGSGKDPVQSASMKRGGRTGCSSLKKRGCPPL